MFNPDACSDCYKQMGRREDKPFIGPVAPALCPACATKHGEQQCWGHQCTCPCNVTFGDGMTRLNRALKALESISNR